MPDKYTRQALIAQSVMHNGETFSPSEENVPALVPVPDDFPDRFDLSRGTPSPSEAPASGTTPDTTPTAFSGGQLVDALRDLGVAITATGNGGTVTIEDVITALEQPAPGDEVTADNQNSEGGVNALVGAGASVSSAANVANTPPEVIQPNVPTPPDELAPAAEPEADEAAGTTPDAGEALDVETGENVGDDDSGPIVTRTQG